MLELKWWNLGCLQADDSHGWMFPNYWLPWPAVSQPLSGSGSKKGRYAIASLSRQGSQGNLRKNLSRKIVRIVLSYKYHNADLIHYFSLKKIVLFRPLSPSLWTQQDYNCFICFQHNFKYKFLFKLDFYLAIVIHPFISNLMQLYKFLSKCL